MGPIGMGPKGQHDFYGVIAALLFSAEVSIFRSTSEHPNTEELTSRGEVSAGQTDAPEQQA